MSLKVLIVAIAVTSLCGCHRRGYPQAQPEVVVLHGYRRDALSAVFQALMDQRLPDFDKSKAVCIQFIRHRRGWNYLYGPDRMFIAGLHSALPVYPIGNCPRGSERNELGPVILTIKRESYMAGDYADIRMTADQSVMTVTYTNFIRCWSWRVGAKWSARCMRVAGEITNAS